MTAGSTDRTAEGFDAYLEQTIAGVPRPVDWRRVRAVDAPETWAALDAWTRWLVDRYALDIREVPACWYLHGALVQELSALHGACLVAFDRNQAASAAADWHRTLWDARLRLRDWLSRTGCTAREHRDDSPSTWTAPSDAYTTALRTHIETEVQARRSAEIHSAVGP